MTIRLNTVGLCHFGFQFAPYPIVEVLNAVTGWNVTLEEIFTTGERIQALRQAFNSREGVIATKLPFPKRVLGDPPLRTGPSRGITLDLETMTKEFYKEMKWDWPSGRPEKARLKELGLDFVAEELYD